MKKKNHHQNTSHFNTQKALQITGITKGYTPGGTQYPILWGWDWLRHRNHGWEITLRSGFNIAVKKQNKIYQNFKFVFKTDWKCFPVKANLRHLVLMHVMR